MIQISTEIRKQIFKFFKYYVFTIIEAGIGFYTIYYLTTKILPEEFGMIGIFASLLFFMPSILTFSSNSLQAIQIIDLSEKEYFLFRNKFISFTIIVSFFLFLTIIPFAFFFKEYCFVIISAVIVGVLQTFSIIHSTELIQNGKAIKYGYLTSGTTFLTLISTIIFLSFFDLDWKFRIVAIILSEFFIFIIRYFLVSDIAKSFKFDVDIVQFKYFITYGYPLMIAVIAGWILNQSDRYFILYFFDIKVVGLYAAAAAIAKVINMINQTMLKVVMPSIYKLLKLKKGRKRLLKVQIIYAIFILLLSAFICLLIYYVGDYILGEKYLEAINIIYIFIFSKAFFGIYSMNSLVIDYFKKTKIKLLLTLVSSFLIIILSLTFIPFFGIHGPAYAGLISFILLTIMAIYFSKRLILKNRVV